MKKVYIKRIAFVCLFLIMLSALSVVCVGAEEEYVPVEWTMSDDGQYLYGGKNAYKVYYSPALSQNLYSDARFSFYFMNYVEYEGEYCQVYGASANPHIVYIKHGDRSTIFADDEGKKILDDFFLKEDCIYYMENDDSEYTVIDYDLVKKLDRAYKLAAANKEALSSVTVLKYTVGVETFEITVHDKTEVSAMQHGVLSIFPDGECYYVRFEDLDNTHFDANGFFSYRDGFVYVLVVKGSLLEEVKSAISDMKIKEKRLVYEHNVVMGYYDIYGEDIEDDYDEGVVNHNTALLFWIGFAFVGYIVPCVPTVFGLVLPNAKKGDHNKGWYALAGFGLVWILSALGIMLILVL